MDQNTCGIKGPIKEGGERRTAPGTHLGVRGRTCMLSTIALEAETQTFNYILL